jgi:hypothetical protein
MVGNWFISCIILIEQKHLSNVGESMPKSYIIRSLRKLPFVPLLLLLFISLACNAFIPTASTTPTLQPNGRTQADYPTASTTPTPQPNGRMQADYPTGISISYLQDEWVVAFDQKGSYCLVFPSQWEVGAFHTDFVPIVNQYCEINSGICSLFNTIYGKDSSLRIFAIDTTSEHLSKDSMATIHIGMHQEEWRLKSSMDELTAEYVAYIDINSSGQLKIAGVFTGTTNYEVPFAVLLIEPTSVSTEEHVQNAYSGVALFKTDYTYVELLYTTFDSSIDIIDELNPILAFFSTCHE